MKKQNSYSHGYRQAVRDIVDKVREERLEIQDPSGDYTAYYPADGVLEMLLDMALNAPEGPIEVSGGK